MTAPQALRMCIDLRGEVTETDPETGQPVRVIYQVTSPALCNAITTTGRLIQRRRVVPRVDPVTPARATCRSAFATAIAAWRALDDSGRAAAALRARGTRHSAYHLFLSRHLRGLPVP